MKTILAVFLFVPFLMAVPIFGVAQTIDIEKCSCNSIARFYSKVREKGYSYRNLRPDTNEIDIVSMYDGYKRTVHLGIWLSDLDYCAYSSPSDSIFVDYSSNERHDRDLRYVGLDYRILPLIVPWDSIVFHKNLYQKIESSEHYQWGYNPFSSDTIFGFNLEEKFSMAGDGQSGFVQTYFSPSDLLSDLRKRDSIRLSKEYEPVLSVFYSTDHNGRFHGKAVGLYS